MVQHCFNPACRQEFQLLHAGDLYALEWGSADTEFFWLCSECACKFTLVLRESGTVALSEHGAPRPANHTTRGGELRLIARCARPAPRPDSRPTTERKYSFVHGAEPHFSGYRPRASSAAWEREDELTTLAGKSAA
ncbi:MAG TPA: hypothetical protein VJU82_18890 [Acidobacteriaceae bacterium]|nr:hypothetical protein [Acidobacteriaceae bacterium]